MPRHYLVTGAAGGIGSALVELLTSRGAEVIRSDLATGDIPAELSTPSGRSEFAAAVADLDHLDGFIAVAGVGPADPVTVRLNYFGTLAALRTVRPALARSPAGRATVVSSLASVIPTDRRVVRACLAGDEDRAVAAAERAIDHDNGRILYGSSKIALNRWLRRTAGTADWAGAGIPLNAVAPGVVETEAAHRLVLDDPTMSELTRIGMPQPLGFPGPVEAIAESLAWLTSETNSFMTGQVIFVDGGAETVIRGDHPTRLRGRYSLPTKLAILRRYRQLRRTSS